ncbi:hypothetical protein DYBT9275_02319 [Dyadobacter sp. CECT 9275]|uniref:Sigma-70 family RNA polymerase sigma factor n=1 Tax=Dyadobacter helix TaxID=2822344 RepID=A0A916JBL8_9BACT|nr:sigma-70 family RNA polymerase sigma factor [Dyadobacter sp. CECT 9275]CAG4999832.1 hypothetical protein DYBT9275_02319 [Dyadobacter sp. CECT 9275]
MSEALLWRNFKLGDKQAFEQIFIRYHKDLYQYGSKIIHNGPLLDDAIQELFLELWQTKEQLADVVSVKGYLFRALKFKLFREIKKEARLVALSGENEELPDFSYETTLIEEQAAYALKEKLLHTIQKLTRRQQEALFLRFYSQLSYEEISEVMDVSYQGVVNLIYKSIRFLRENMTFLIGYLLTEMMPVI